MGAHRGPIEPEWVEQVGRAAAETQLFGAALVVQFGRRGRLREGHAARGADRRRAPGGLRSDRRAQPPGRSSSGPGWSRSSGIPATPTRSTTSAHNRAVLREAEDVADRTRRRGMLVDDQAIFDFYDARLPSEVTSGGQFRRLVAQPPRPVLPRHSTSDLLTDADDRDAARADFPDHWAGCRVDLPVSYVFEPGDGRDGAR